MICKCCRDPYNQLISPSHLTGCSLLHDATPFAGHCWRPPELYPKMTTGFHENEDILSETRAHIRTFQRQHRTALGRTQVHSGKPGCIEVDPGTFWCTKAPVNEGSCDWKDREQRKSGCILQKSFCPPIPPRNTSFILQIKIIPFILWRKKDQ